MGGTKEYLEKGGFSEQKYKTTGITANGIKIIADEKGRGKTPTFSNTPGTMYAKENSKGVINQITVYGNGEDGRGKLKDIDTGHSHNNRDRNGHVTQRFAQEEIHVQEYDANGKKLQRARKPSKKERRLLMVARYGKRE